MKLKEISAQEAEWRPLFKGFCYTIAMRKTWLMKTPRFRRPRCAGGALLVLAVALSALGSVGERPGVLTGTPDAPLLVSGIGKKGGRVYLLGTDGRIVWEQSGCGNIHRLSCGNSVLCKI